MCGGLLARLVDREHVHPVHRASRDVVGDRRDRQSPRAAFARFVEVDMPYWLFSQT